MNLEGNDYSEPAFLIILIPMEGAVYIVIGQ